MTLLTHEQVRRLLDTGREQLSVAERVELDQHLAECAECRSSAAELATLQSALGRVMHTRWDGLRPDPKLESAIRAQIRTRTMPKQIFSNVLGLATLLVFIVVLVALFSSRTQSAATQSPIATPQITPAPSSSAIAMGTPALSPFPSPTPLSGQDFYQLQRLTTTSDGAYGPAVSPDGRRIAYASLRHGNTDIFTLDLTTQVETRLTDDPLYDEAPSWSPDGTHIAYQHRNTVPTGSWFVGDQIVMNADGSNKQVVSSGTRLGDALAWSPSGDRLAFTDGFEIVVVNVNDRRELRRFGPVESQVYRQPVWFDDNRIMFLSQGVSQETVVLGNVTTGAVEQVPGTSDAVQVMPMQPDIAYLQQDGSTARVIRQDLGGTYSSTISVFQAKTIESAAPSPDGRFVAVETDLGMYVANEHVPVSWQHAPMFRLGTDDALLGMSWLPDSSGFVFAAAPDSKAAAESDLYLVRLNLGTIKIVEDNEPVAQVPPLLYAPTPTPLALSMTTPSGQDFYRLQRLTTTSNGAYRPAVSPDGRRIAYTSLRNNNWDIFTLDLTTQVETRLTDDPLNDMAPSWSPDGTHLAYQHYASAPNGPELVDRIVMNADGSNKQVVSSGAQWLGNEAPVWSPAGDRIAFADGSGVVVVSVNDRREVQRFMPTEVQSYRSPAWFDDKRLIMEGKDDAAFGKDVIVVGQVDSGATSLDKQSRGALMIERKHWAYVELDNLRQYLSGNPMIGSIQDAALSFDGSFLVILSDTGAHVFDWSVLADKPSAKPLFSISGNIPPSDLNSVAWLPDSSGFVFEAAPDGQPGLYLAQLNMGTIKIVEDNEPVAEVPPLLSTPTPTAIPVITPVPFPSPTPPSGQDFYQIERLTTTSHGAYRPAVSPDGQRVIYTNVRDVRYNNWDIYLLDLTTRVETRLTDDPRNDMAPSWSPDGTRIAYQRYAPATTSPELVERVVMNADGSNPQVVASGAPRWGNEPPAWSPDGTRIAFTDDVELVVVSINDRRELRRFDLVERQIYSQPVWFDNDRILFISQGVLRLGNVATGAVEPVVGPSGFVSQVMVRYPAIVYIQQAGTAARVIGQDLDGTHAFTLTTFQVNPVTQSGPVQSAALSPNGRFVAAQIDPGIYVADITTEQPLSFNLPTGMPPTDLAGIAWLPDSSGFVCVTARDSQSDLYLVRPIPRMEHLDPYWLAGIPGASMPTPTPMPTLLPSTAVP